MITLINLDSFKKAVHARAQELVTSPSSDAKKLGDLLTNAALAIALKVGTENKSISLDGLNAAFSTSVARSRYGEYTPDITREIRVIVDRLDF